MSDSRFTNSVTEKLTKAQLHKLTGLDLSGPLTSHAATREPVTEIELADVPPEDPQGTGDPASQHLPGDTNTAAFRPCTVPARTIGRFKTVLSMIAIFLLLPIGLLLDWLVPDIDISARKDDP